MKTKILVALLLVTAGFINFATARPDNVAQATSDKPPLPDTSLYDKSPSEIGFQPIFNGKDLTGWDGSPELWSVKDGAITGQTTVEHPAKENTFLIWTNGAPADFELRCSFKLLPGD